MQIAALPIPFYRAASNRPPEVTQTAAVRLKLLEQWRPLRGVGDGGCARLVGARFPPTRE